MSNSKYYQLLPESKTTAKTNAELIPVDVALRLNKTDLEIVFHFTYCRILKFSSWINGSQILELIAQEECRKQRQKENALNGKTNKTGRSWN